MRPDLHANIDPIPSPRKCSHKRQPAGECAWNGSFSPLEPGSACGTLPERQEPFSSKCNEWFGMAGEGRESQPREFLLSCPYQAALWDSNRESHIPQISSNLLFRLLRLSLWDGGCPQ